MRRHCRVSPASEIINLAFLYSTEAFFEDARQKKNSAIKTNIVAAKEFTGAKMGYVFKLSKLGLGYYIDSRGDPFVAEVDDNKESWHAYLQQLTK